MTTAVHDPQVFWDILSLRQLLQQVCHPRMPIHPRPLAREHIAFGDHHEPAVSDLEMLPIAFEIEANEG